jgi:DNA-binding beta-propeller fold protein YncE
MSWAFVVYRSVGSVYQDDIFSIRGKFPFEKESPNASSVQLFVLNVALATPLNQPTTYLSTTRQTKVRVDFQFSDNNTTGTPPTDMWVYLIRNDSQNNQLDYYENYEYDQSDLTNGLPGVYITPVTIPTNITSNEFFTEFDVSQLRTDLGGIENISNNYRFIFVVTSALDRQSRSWVTEPIQLINYDDQDLTLTGIEAKFRTVEQEYAGTIGTLTGTCVNMNLETALQANLPLSDTEVQAKTGNQIMTAFEAYKGARLSIYEESPLTGSQLLNTQYFQASGQLICDKVTDNGLEPIVNRTQGSLIDLTFPFTIPDNVYRKIGREGLFQSDVTEPTAWSTLSLASLSCVQNRTSEQCDVLFALPDIAGSLNTQYMAYVPDTNELWVANGGNDNIIVIDLNTMLISTTIALTALDQPTGIVYVPGIGVYVTCTNANVIRLVNIYTRTVLSSVVSPVSPQQIIFEPSINRLFVIGSLAGDLWELNASTGALVTTIATGLTTPFCVTYEPSINTLYVAGSISNDFCLIPRSTNIPSAPIATVGNPVRILSTGSNIWITGINDLEVIDFTGTSLNTQNYPSMSGGGLVENAGVVYVTDTSAQLIRTFDSTLFSQITTYPAGLATENLTFGGGYLWAGGVILVRPFLLDCNDSLPPFTMVNRNIKLNWDLEFQFFDNTEIYTISQELNRPSPRRFGDLVDDFNDIIIEEYDRTPTPIPINNLCPTTGQVIVTANFINPQRVMSVGIELQPVRGGVYTSESSASPISIPSDSEAIYDLTPAYGTTSTVQFKIDTPSLNLTGDYEILLHFITQ